MEQDEPRVAEILDLTMRLASGDLTARGQISSAGDALDAILAGLNMLAEELSAVSEARNALERELAHRAEHDPLTGMPNRVELSRRLDHDLSQNANGTGRVAVLFIDLDDFKPVNDQLGHEVGDGLLIEVGRRIAETVRPQDLAGRLGGDEFAVVALLESPTDADVMADHIVKAIAKPFQIKQHAITVGASVGVATNLPDDTAKSILRHADQALYVAKEQRGRAITYTALIPEDKPRAQYSSRPR